MHYALFQIVINNNPASEIPFAFFEKGEGRSLVFLLYKHRWPFSIFRKQCWPTVEHSETLTYRGWLYIFSPVLTPEANWVKVSKKNPER